MPPKKTAVTSATTKARKPAAKKTAVAAAPPSQEQIAQVAERFWIERGRPIGSPETDWIRAVEELTGAHA